MKEVVTKMGGGVTFYSNDVKRRKPDKRVLRRERRKQNAAKRKGIHWRKSVPHPVGNEPLVAGLSAEEWAHHEAEEESRFTSGETKEITEPEFRALVQTDVLCGVKLPATADDWLKNHLFTIGDRPKVKQK